MSKFRILSIDGGGIKGMLPASILASLEQSTGKRIIDHFDLIAGASTGGIIALALALEVPASEILTFYKQHGHAIFPADGLSARFSFLRRLFRHGYDPKHLRSALTDVFHERTLGDAKTRVVIPSFSASTGDVYIFKTRHHPRLRYDASEKVVDVAMATSAAPTYFPTHGTPRGVRLIDGGMWSNNPLLLAVIEAMSILDVPREDIYALSLGCTSTPKQLGEFTQRNSGILSWTLPVTEWLMHGQAAFATNGTSHLIGKDHLVRVQHEAAPGAYALDNPRAAQQLEGVGVELARTHSPAISEVFLNEPVVPFRAAE